MRLFVGSIPGSATEKDVRELFEKYGEISDLYYNNAKNFAFVKYPASGADKAQMEVHGMTFKGKTLNVHNAGIVALRYMHRRARTLQSNGTGVSGT